MILFSSDKKLPARYRPVNSLNVDVNHYTFVSSLHRPVRTQECEELGRSRVFMQLHDNAQGTTWYTSHSIDKHAACEEISNMHMPLTKARW